MNKAAHTWDLGHYRIIGQRRPFARPFAAHMHKMGAYQDSDQNVDL